MGTKGFSGWLKAKRSFVTLLTDLVATLELEKREDGLNPIDVFWEEYLPALALVQL